ncbi:MAG: acetylglutamate kinase [Bacteroidetes bacterium]|nr:MAG: acetylglutamate kinase [Bacteroidota bacterium]
MKDKLIVGKIGGNVIDNPDLLNTVLDYFANLPHQKVLVHGGGILATQLAEVLNIPQQMHEGRRITSAKTLEVAQMVYAGKINTDLVAKLHSRGLVVQGVNGADGAYIQSEKRSVKPIDFGFVGDIVKVDGERLARTLSSGVVPVFSAITADLNGQLYNTNGDTQASEIAMALSDFYEVELIYCFDKPGVLRDVLDPSSVLKTLSIAEYTELKVNGAIYQGMIPKLDTGFRALNYGVQTVILGGTEVFNPIQTIHTELVL